LLFSSFRINFTIPKIQPPAIRNTTPPSIGIQGGAQHGGPGGPPGGPGGPPPGPGIEDTIKAKNNNPVVSSNFSLSIKSKNIYSKVQD